MNSATATRLILLIDGENLPAKFADAVVAKAADLGSVVETRVYGHFDNERLNGWAEPITRLDLVKVDVPQSNRRKNSADFKLVVEAMDMLHTRHLDGFCIASSDGDFTALAERIRAGALTLYIFGEKKAPEQYRALGRFFDVADLAAARKKPVAPPARPAPVAAARSSHSGSASPRTTRRGKATGGTIAPAQPKAKTEAPKSTPQLPGKEPIPTEKILAAMDKIAKSDGWARAQDVGNTLTSDGKFRIKTYAGSVNTLLRATPGVQLEKRGSDTWVRRA